MLFRPLFRYGSHPLLGLMLRLDVPSCFTYSFIRCCGGEGGRSRSGERTCVLVKGDGVQRGVVGEVVGRLERRGFQLTAIKMLVPSEHQLSLHYSHAVPQPYYPKLLQAMSLGPTVAMVWEGRKVIEVVRKIIGTTNPEDSPPGTIRGDLAIHKRRNIVHGSDSVESAEKEIKIWFDEKEVIKWNQSMRFLYEET